LGQSWWRSAACATAPPLRYILWDLIDQQGNRNVVVDLRDLTVGDGADLEPFVDATRSARQGGGHLVLSRPSDANSEALARAGLIEALDPQPATRNSDRLLCPAG
jgi:anti-anti-sigma regulatory factor